MNKRILLGLISAGALFLGVGVARTVITTERIVTDEALGLAQQTGQPVWETYQRNVWLAWVGSAIAVTGVSGIGAALYARDEELDEMSLRANQLRDRVTTALPALEALVAPDNPALPPLERDASSPSLPAGIPTTKASAEPTQPETRESPPSLAPSIDESPRPAVTTPHSKQPHSVSEPGAEPKLEPEPEPAVELKPEPEPEPIAIEASPELDRFSSTGTNPPLQFTLATDTLEESPASATLHSERSPEFEDVASPDTASQRTHDLSQSAPEHPRTLDDLIGASALCVAGDDRHPVVARAKANLLSMLVARRLDSGHQCVVCDPLGRAEAWHGCDRVGHDEDYATIDTTIAAIVAEIETRRSAAQNGQTDFSPLTFACFLPSLWLNLCASSSLLAARSGDAARVAVSLLTIEDCPPTDWTAFGQQELAFPSDLFIDSIVETRGEESALLPEQVTPIVRWNDPGPSDAAGGFAWEAELPNPLVGPRSSPPPLRSRPPVVAASVEPIDAVPPAESVMGQSPLQIQSENGYPMADTETEQQLRSQIALFQDLNMTREQIILAVWDVRDPTSAEYELASTFYDRLTS